MTARLVIVESPTKAKTLRKFLGNEYSILASVGHVKDLPSSKLGVDIDKQFAPQYVTISGKEKILRELKKAAESVDQVLLATDPDREGEAIAWHLSEELELSAEQKKNCRVLINEFTQSVVKEAVNQPQALDLDKINSQQARRVLDRIVGYKISPLLWRKVQSGLSAGRVQSVALKLIVDREREVGKFVPEEFWTLTVDLACSDDLNAAHTRPAAAPAGDSDADSDGVRRFTVELKKVDGKAHTIRSKTEVDGILADLETVPFKISRIAAIKKSQRPHAPFITSTLQQAASRVFDFSAKKTMMIAQQLYEGVELEKGRTLGLITYMRTDSTRVSARAQEDARTFVTSTLGAQYLPATPPIYKSGKGKVQDAHEAIRPTEVALVPAAVKPHLTNDQFKLYCLVWSGFLGSQMAPAQFLQTTIDVTAGRYLLRAAGRTKLFDGYLRIYEEHKVIPKKVKEAELPPLKESDPLSKTGQKAVQGFTQPPPRFTEATLVKSLEENGIGRPSTYATIISTLIDRKYAERKEKNLHPTELGSEVCGLLAGSFQRIMDVAFTARMEEELDEIEAGKCVWQKPLEEFYTDFRTELENAEKTMRDLKKEVTPTGENCENCGKPLVIRRGRFGKFISCSGYPKCTYKRNIAPDGSTTAAATAPQVLDEKCDKCGGPMVLRTGRYGPFKACSAYPKCKNTKPVPNPVGIACPLPDCTGGQVVTRFTKRHRPFFGCTRYPQCKFTSWQRPTGQNCPLCQSFLVERRQKGEVGKVACSSKTCSYTADAPVVPAKDGAPAAVPEGAGAPGSPAAA